MKLKDLMSLLKFTCSEKSDGENTQQGVQASDSDRPEYYGAHTIVVKDRKRSAQIQCWKCGKLLWVKKGFECFHTGLCSYCLTN